MDVLRWQDEPIEALSSGIGRRMLNGEAMTLAQITLAAGAAVPLHEHPNEQIATVLSGRLRFLVGDEELEVGAGESVLISGGVPHRVDALEDSVVLDAFAPRREDWLRGDDAYLRGSQK